MDGTQSTTRQPLHLAESLDVQGWSHLDAVILAALATCSPVLLVGLHGTAKSFLVERLALALGLSFRHFNASLVNYDDLVGIPLPGTIDHTLELDCARHARLFFGSADLGLDTAAPGTFTLKPSSAMRDALAKDYEAMAGMVFGDVPPLDVVLASAERLEAAVRT